MTNTLNLALQSGTPLIDGNRVTFVWQGQTPPQLRGDFNNWQGQLSPWQQEEDGVWIHQLELPSDAYIEYCFGPEEDRVADPFNTRFISNGIGALNNYFYMPESQPNPLLKKRRGVPAGTVTRFDVATHALLADKQRRIWLYRPPTDKTVPLVVVYDGGDYLQRAKLPTIVDNLIAQKRIQPLAMALIDSGGLARTAEYACSDASIIFLQQHVIPLARQHLNLTENSYAVLGTSMGGLMAMYTAWRMPHLFNRVLSQSGVFHLGGYPSVLMDLVTQEKRPLKIWMDVGQYDWLLGSNQAMHQLLQHKRYALAYHQFNAGHNFTAWSNNVWEGLEWLFPPETR